MKKMMVCCVVVLLFSQCSIRLTKNPLFSNVKGVDAIDTSVLRKYVNEDSLAKTNSYTYRRGTQKVTVSGGSGLSYDLIIKEANTEDRLFVSRKAYHILSISRETHGIRKEDVVNIYRYFPNGSLATKYSEKNIQKLIQSEQPQFIKTGTNLKYTEKPHQIETAFDYDNEFTFKVKAVIKRYKNKIIKNRTNVDIKQFFIDHPFNPKNSTDLIYMETFRIKSQYPYWEIKLIDSKTRVTNAEIIDGKTGTLI